MGDFSFQQKADAILREIQAAEACLSNAHWLERRKHIPQEIDLKRQWLVILREAETDFRNAHERKTRP